MFAKKEIESIGIVRMRDLIKNDKAESKKKVNA